MAGELNDERGISFYDEFYKTGGWKYSLWREYWWHRRNLVKRFRLKRGMRLLEVACGSGFHTQLFSRMGFRCDGIDRSEAGIAWAKQHYHRPTYHCCTLDEMPFEPHSFDVIVARGCSHYHYDLSDQAALDATATIARYLKPGGVFAMIILTDLSGRREPGTVWQNTLDDYREHFNSFGKQWSVDWVDGMAICELRNIPLAATSVQQDPQPMAALAT